MTRVGKNWSGIAWATGAVVIAAALASCGGTSEAGPSGGSAGSVGTAVSDGKSRGSDGSGGGSEVRYDSAQKLTEVIVAAMEAKGSFTATTTSSVAGVGSELRAKIRGNDQDYMITVTAPQKSSTLIYVDGKYYAKTPKSPLGKVWLEMDAGMARADQLLAGAVLAAPWHQQFRAMALGTQFRGEPATVGGEQVTKYTLTLGADGMLKALRVNLLDAATRAALEKSVEGKTEEVRVTVGVDGLPRTVAVDIEVEGAGSVTSTTTFSAWGTTTVQAPPADTVSSR